MTQQQPPVPQVQEQPDAFKAVEAGTAAEWWRQLEAIMRPKEVKP